MYDTKPFSEEGLLVGCAYRSKANTQNIYVASDCKTLVYKNYTLKSTREYFVKNFCITDCSVREITKNWGLDIGEFDKLVHHFMNIEELRRRVIIKHSSLKTPYRHRPEMLWFDKIKHKYTGGY